ncbi:helix-turn-helix domain-containing protein [Candidatus Dojkabacteria bacterium]|nr:helix-turn-helix domain-containing protein [Candidatus Dojkabacteria bacterium]
METLKNENTTELFKAFLQLNNIEEVANFCADLMTPDEIKEFAKRWKIAQQLNEGKSQRTIAKDLRLSITTVTRVNKWLRNGTNGYRTVLERINTLHHHKPKFAGL